MKKLEKVYQPSKGRMIAFEKWFKEKVIPFGKSGGFERREARQWRDLHLKNKGSKNLGLHPLNKTKTVGVDYAKIAKENKRNIPKNLSYEKGAVDRWAKKRKKILQEQRAMRGIKKKNQLMRKQMMKKSLGKVLKKVGGKAAKLGLGATLGPAGAMLAGLAEVLSIPTANPNQMELVRQHNLKHNIPELREEE